MLALDIAPFAGPCFVIVWLSFILYGLFLAQLYIYFTTYRDHNAIVLIVSFLAAMETMQVAACIHVAYTNLIIDFGNPLKLLTIVWSDIWATSLELIINGVVQSYYVYRIWRLSKNIPIAVTLSVALATRTALGFVATSYSVTHREWLELATLKPYKDFVEATISLSIVIDASITISLLFYLSRARSLAHKRSTRITVYKLTYYALSTGGLTFITTVVTLIVFKTSKSPILYGGLITLMAKVYANSMLAMLNIRQGLRMGMGVVSDAIDSDRVQLSDIATRVEPVQMAARVHVIQETVTDDRWNMAKVTPEDLTKV